MRKQGVAVLILGAGEIGLALAAVFRKRRRARCALWDKDARKTPRGLPLRDLASAADIVFLCVPSRAVREALQNVRPFLKLRAIVVILAKGIERKTCKRVDEIARELLPRGRQFALLGGPMLAEELCTMPTIGIVASRSKTTFRAIQSAFQNSGIILEYTSDVPGVALSSVLKNVYAIGLGMADALALGGNARGVLMTRAVQEMMDITRALGGRVETVLGAAGIGDLLATAFSPYSRNREAGRSLVRTGACCLESEGVAALPSLLKLLRAGLPPTEVGVKAGPPERAGSVRAGRMKKISAPFLRAIVRSVNGEDPRRSLFRIFTVPGGGKL